MMNALKSEFRKLFTVRSTYIILLLALGLEIFFAFYATSFHANAKDALNPKLLSQEVIDAIGFLSTFAALVGVLLVTHEYRYNTIVYTLTASNSRTKVLIAKIIAISCFAIAFAAVFSMLSPALSSLGWHLKGVTLAHQDFHVWNLLVRAVFAGWAFAMLGFIFAVLIRIQVGAIATIFLFPGTVEQLLGLLFKKNQVYLPYSSVNEVLNPHTLTYQKAALVASLYVIVGWVIAWIFFTKRDAN